MRTSGMIIALALTTTMTPAVATPPAVADAYVAECGACHVAYPPRLLAAHEWSLVMGNLGRHYGVDASVDEATLRAIAPRLGVAKATPPRVATLPRITTKSWFVDEHDEVGAATFRATKVGSAANCSACHAGAERGDFDEHSVRIPR